MVVVPSIALPQLEQFRYLERDKAGRRLPLDLRNRTDFLPFTAHAKRNKYFHTDHLEE